MKIATSLLEAPSVDALPVEIVERKGQGHPDSICDGLAEEFSLSLSRFYLKRFGMILHHNVDKVLLWGGESRPAFGGGRVVKPIEVFIAGRATHAFKGVTVPVEEIALAACRDWFSARFHALDAERDVRVHVLVRPGSQDLVDLYLRQQRTGRWLANDTSCGVGYAPLTPLEAAVYHVERTLNSAEVKGSRPETGEDVKVMGVRCGDDVRMTVACALVDRFVADLDDYAGKKAAIEDLARGAAAAHLPREASVSVNVADDPAAGSVYLTVTGTSAEAGDDGQAGRGNRANGLITPYRPMTMESVAGKNPVTHVGKLYNLAASLAAAALVDEVPEVGEARCSLVSQIGTPIEEPQVVDLHVRLAEPRSLNQLRPRLEEIAGERIAAVGSLWKELVDGTLAIDRWPLRQ